MVCTHADCGPSTFFCLVCLVPLLQKKGAIDAAKDNIRMKGDGHEMVIRTDSTSADRLKEAGMPLEVGDEWSEQFEFDAEGNINHKDSFSYKR